MKSMDNIEEALKKKLSFTAGVKMHDRILRDVLDTHEACRTSKPALTRPNTRRIIMKSPITKLAAAAVIITAILMGIKQFGGLINITSVSWADVANKFQLVTSFDATFYIRDDTSSETVQVDLWVGSGGKERIKTKEQVLFAEKGKIISGFNYVKQEKINDDQIERKANAVLEMIGKSERFSLETIVQTMSNGVLKEITPMINSKTVIAEDIVVFDLTNEGFPLWLRILALRESKLPIRILVWKPENGQYIDVVINYSREQSAAFFDPDEYQKFLRNNDILGDIETNLAYALYKEPGGRNYVPADLYKKYRNTEDLRTLKEHLSDEELAEYYKAHPLVEGQMDFRKGQMKGGLTIGSIKGLEDYKLWRVGTTVDFFARGYHVPSYGRMRFDGDFNDIFLQYDIVGRGEIPYQKYVEAVLSRVGLEIIESEDLCTVWIAEYNGQQLKSAISIKCPFPNAPAGTPGALSAAYMFKVKDLLRYLAKDQDVIVEDNTVIDQDKELSTVIPNFKTEVGVDLAQEWYLENFGITFKIEQRRMPVWIVRKKAQ